MSIKRRRQTVVIVIPTYNEKENVPVVAASLSQVFKKLSKYNMQILFVDDQSPDGTGRAVTLLAKKYPFIHLLTNKRKGGLGHAYKKGMVFALDKMRAGIIFEFDADLSHDPSKIPSFLRNLEQGSALVLGSRYIPGGGIPPNWPWYRKFLSVLGNLFIGVVMTNWQIRDWTTGYRAIRAELVRKILPQLTSSAFHGYTWQIGFLVKTIQMGFKVSEVPFHFRDRTLGHSKLGPEYIFNTLRYIMKTRFTQIVHNRLFKFVVVGAVGSLVQLLSLYFYRLVFVTNWGPLTAYQIAFVLAIETAIVSNFILSNLWTFRDRKLAGSEIPSKFIQFNLASGGSILLQFLLASAGERFIGLFTLFVVTWPVTLIVDTGLVYAVVGILIGMFWNYFAYSRLVWRKK